MDSNSTDNESNFQNKVASRVEMRENLWQKNKNKQTIKSALRLKSR